MAMLNIGVYTIEFNLFSCISKFSCDFTKRNMLKSNTVYCTSPQSNLCKEVSELFEYYFVKPLLPYDLEPRHRRDIQTNVFD